jgi:colicin import membrane protein
MSKKESSVMFSLNELMRIEDDRIESERKEQERRALETAQALLEAERRAREATIARLLAEEEAARMEDFRRRTEETRLEAIKQAELERARKEAEHRARMETLAAQHSHQEQIAVVRNDASKKKLKRAAVMSVGGLLVVALGGGLLWKHSSDQKDEETATLFRQAQMTQAELDRLKSDLADKERKVKDLESQLDDASDEGNRARLQDELNKAKKDSDDVRRRVGTGKSTVAGTKPCSCPPGDPLCSCL